jgi:hypothetical protein
VKELDYIQEIIIKKYNSRFLLYKQQQHIMLSMQQSFLKNIRNLESQKSETEKKNGAILTTQGAIGITLFNIL